MSLTNKNYDLTDLTHEMDLTIHLLEQLNSVKMHKCVLVLGFDIESSNLIFESCNKHFGKSEIINGFLHKFVCTNNQLSGSIIYAITTSHSYQEYMSFLRQLYRTDFDTLFKNVIIALRTDCITNSCKVFLNRLIKKQEHIYIAKYVPNRKLDRFEIPHFHCWSILGDSELLPYGTLYIPMKQVFDNNNFDVVVMLNEIWNTKREVEIKA